MPENWAWFSNYQIIIDIITSYKPMDEYEGIYSDSVITYQYIIVGATMVSSIVLHDKIKEGTIIQPGQELGYFQYSGSTIIMTFPIHVIPKYIFTYGDVYVETQVRKNEVIGLPLF